MENKVVLSVQNLSKHFGDNQVLKGVNLDIRQGDKIVIVGASGCGKSTFLRCLNCLEDPTGGHIYFDGEDLADMKVDINVHRQKIGMVFQNFNLFNNLTVLQNVTLAPIIVAKKKIRKIKTKNFFTKIGNFFKKEKAPLLEISQTIEQVKAQANAKAMELLKKIGLEEKANAYPSTLSGGQKQRIAIVRALAMEPEIMLFSVKGTDDASAAGRAEVDRKHFQFCHSYLRVCTMNYFCAEGRVRPLTHIVSLLYHISGKIV